MEKNLATCRGAFVSCKKITFKNIFKKNSMHVLALLPLETKNILNTDT